jgi:hypothetical protein
VFRFEKSVISQETGKPYKVEVDFITEPEGAERLPKEWLGNVQRDLKTCIIEGSSIVFKYNHEVKFKAFMPEDGEATATVYSAEILGSLTMKGLALYRMKDKDSYDIYTFRRRTETGIKSFHRRNQNQEESRKIILDSLEEIRNAFSSTTAVAKFIGTEDARIDSYQRIKTFLEKL